MQHLTTKNPQKIPKFHCVFCNYITNNKKDFTKHMATLKHINLSELQQITTQKSPNIPKSYDCINCGKSYKYRDGLWRHKKTCKEPTVADVFANNSTVQITDLMLKMIEQNKDLTNKIVELSKSSTINYTTNNVNSNNKFNLNMYLNETCKDAINISDFVESLVVSVKDLEETARLGYSEGISQIFINKLLTMNEHSRPIHCSDAKREILYIKNQDKWEKDNETNDIITHAIKTVAHKNIKMIPEWMKLNPDYNDAKSKTNDKYLKIVMNSMSGSTEEEQKRNINKIISNVAKETVISK